VTQLLVTAIGDSYWVGDGIKAINSPSPAPIRPSAPSQLPRPAEIPTAARQGATNGAGWGATTTNCWRMLPDNGLLLIELFL